MIKNPWAKHTKTERNNQIRQLYHNTELSQADLAQLFKVSRARIFQILYGRGRKPKLEGGDG